MFLIHKLEMFIFIVMMMMRIGACGMRMRRLVMVV